MIIRAKNHFNGKALTGDVLGEFLLRTNIVWSQLKIHLCDIKPNVLTQEFFTKFFDYIRDSAEFLLQDALTIIWITEYEFQENDLRSYIESWKKRNRVI